MAIRMPGDERADGRPAEPPQGLAGDLVDRDVAGAGLVAERGERRHLHEVEVVQQTDPGDAGQDVEPAEPEVAESCPAEEPICCEHRRTSFCWTSDLELATDRQHADCATRRRERSTTVASYLAMQRRRLCDAMAHEFIYTCYKLARVYPPDRTVLENISLSFYPGRQDRRARRQRRRQVEPAADHGRPRRRLQRRGPADARLHASASSPRSRSSIRRRT